MTPRRVDVPASTRATTGETAAYILGEDDALLVDPAAWTDALAAVDVGHVAVTHHHPDHVGGVSAVADHSDCTVWARAGRADAFRSATGCSPDRLFTPSSVIPAAGGVRVLDAPGHAHEHVAFTAGDGLITGDIAVAEGSVVVGPPDGDMRAYLTTLRRIYVRDPDRLYPAHGPVIDEPRAVCLRLLRHRLARERAVEQAVGAGARTPADIVDAVYEKDVSAVRDLARATVVAHVEKLAVEGHIEWDGTRAHPL